MSIENPIIQRFRKNDLIDNAGKQFELGKSWCEEFFHINEEIQEITIPLIFKAITPQQKSLNNTVIELKLSGVSARQDRKAYDNTGNGISQIKDLFINKLGLTEEKNLEDYFAIYRTTAGSYCLYVIPQLLCDNFIKIIKSQSVSILVHDQNEVPEIQIASPDESRQVIYYGAPGTGKSNRTNEIIKKLSHTRTTFHPDSDYSTFVGAYKPMAKRNVSELLGFNELVEILKQMRDSKKENYSQIFGAKYWNSLGQKDISVLGIVSACSIEPWHVQEINKGRAVGEALGRGMQADQITYEFIPQAFAEAYIRAWKNYPEPHYLIIEEINRGNCAQIFGDLFQLLDRGDEQFSVYPINVDNDLGQYIRKHFPKDFKSEHIKEINALYAENYDNIFDDIREGGLMVLPQNLFIYATMNTSDQSLFPIDSAFKRRWDWKYIPIKKGRDKNDPKKDLNWIIKVNGHHYLWWDFVTEINKRIQDTDAGEDKQLGFFFAKAKNNIISAETLVSKVYFYLWNDVFRMEGFDGDIFKDGDNGILHFPKFFNEDEEDSINEEEAEQFLKNLRLKTVDVDEDEDDEDEEQTDENN